MKFALETHLDFEVPEILETISELFGVNGLE